MANRIKGITVGIGGDTVKLQTVWKGESSKIKHTQSQFWHVGKLLKFDWIRYFKSEKTMQDFYSSLPGVPVAGASLPVAAFGFLSIYGKNLFLFIAVVILGIGHIGIHMDHKKEIQ